MRIPQARIFTIVSASVCCALAIIAAHARAASLSGDVNLDGNINSADRIELADFLLGRASLSPEALGNADLNIDGTVDVADFIDLNTLTRLVAMNWSSVDAGGGTSQGGAFTLFGTIGQGDAGTMSGGGFTLEGGLVPGF